MNARPMALMLLLLILVVTAAQAQLESPGPDGPSRISYPVDVVSEAALDSLILEAMSAYHIPGLSACILKDGQIVWSGAYGMADIDAGREVSDSTLFYLASISKTVTATAVMQLWEDGRLDLDDDINIHLPPELQIINPNHPQESITFRQLLTHTSSIDYDWSLIYSLFSWGSDSPIPLEGFLIDYFMPAGAYYSHGPFTDKAPGTAYQYCNQAFALLGYLVEIIADTSFEAYCQERIFAPLGMDPASWFLSGLDLDRIAVPYQYSSGQYLPYGHYGLVVYPAAQLRTSARQLASYLAAYMGMGEFDGARILDSTTVDLMTTVQIPAVASTQGLAWRVSDWPDGGRYYEHPGEVYGCRTLIGCHDGPEEDTGLIVLTNGESSNGLNFIWEALWDYGMLYNRIYPSQVQLSSTFMRPDADTLLLTARFVNNGGHEFTARTVVASLDSVDLDTVGLFDDGLHGDGGAGDGTWGGFIGPLPAEREFTVAVVTTDLQAGADFISEDAARFTTIGPVMLHSYRHTSPDSIPNPGDRLKYEFTLGNAGMTAAAREITSSLTSLDTCAYLIDPVIPQYGSIAAGETAIGDKRQYVKFSDDCPDSVYARFKFDISSDNYVYWTDTLSFFVVHHNFTGTAETECDHPLGFTLYQNYPNPFNPQTTISYQLLVEGDVELAIYNVSGQRVALLIRERQPAGWHQYRWQAGHLASGLYLCRLTAGDAAQMRKLVLLK